MADGSGSPGALLERFRPYLRFLAQVQLPARLRPKLDPSDIVQQTLLQAYAGLADFRGSAEAELAAWLRKILARVLQHAARDFARGKRDVGREEALPRLLEESSARIEAWFAAAGPSPSEQAARNERTLRLAEALDAISEAQREAVTLHYAQGLSLAEIGLRLDRSSAAVAGLIHRGLRELRGRLQESP